MRLAFIIGLLLTSSAATASPAADCMHAAMRAKLGTFAWTSVGKGPDGAPGLTRGVVRVTETTPGQLEILDAETQRVILRQRLTAAGFTYEEDFGPDGKPRGTGEARVLGCGPTDARGFTTFSDLTIEPGPAGAPASEMLTIAVAGRDSTVFTTSKRQQGSTQPFAWHSNLTLVRQPN